MPELPEVQTTVNGINSFIKGRTIVDVWTDLAVENPTLPSHKTSTKSKKFFTLFKKSVIGGKIIEAERRAKNIFIHLDNGISIWIHMKMTGHLLYGKYVLISKEWTPSTEEKNEALRDPFNKYLHTIFTLDNGRHLALSDVRKFAKVTFVKTTELPEIYKEFGPEPLEDTFTFSVFTKQLQKRPTRPIKEVLLDQKIIAGIGNIYSDEALWLAGIHPLRTVRDITDTEMQLLYKGVISALKKGIDFGGDSTSDYRDITGTRGAFQGKHEAYRRTGQPCRKRGCPGTIERIAFSGRGAHFCDTHQT
ncbi:DNA-formamidopyrimidine glycosylase [Patescibacteria group bacterium]|nr:DNA-formamidopyrimidine glycosylase [Patescibacteria group bacterium]